MAQDDNDTSDTQDAGAAMPDLSFIPDDFKAEDGSYKLDDFSAHVTSLSEFKQQADERAASLPTEPSAYQLGVPDDHKFLDGFNPDDFPVPVLNDKGEPTFDKDGQPVTRPMSAEDMIDSNDPDLPLLQQAMLEHKADPALMGKLSSILANRELRSIMKAGEAANAEKQKLGPEGDKRLSTVTAELERALPASQAKALADAITSADALIGLESLFQKSNIPPQTTQSKGFDLDSASNKELIAEGMRRQMNR